MAVSFRFASRRGRFCDRHVVGHISKLPLTSPLKLPHEAHRALRQSYFPLDFLLLVFTAEARNRLDDYLLVHPLLVDYNAVRFLTIVNTFLYRVYSRETFCMQEPIAYLTELVFLFSLFSSLPVSVCVCVCMCVCVHALLTTDN